MTNENRGQWTEDARRMEDRGQTAEDGGQSLPDMEMSPPASELATQDMAGNATESAEETPEPTDTDRETVPQESEPAEEGEATVDQANAPAQEQESAAPEGLEAPLSQGERQTNQVIDMLLGEPRETGQREDRRQTIEDGEQKAEGGEQETADSAGLSSVVSPLSSEGGPPPTESAPTVESVLEAILFATDEPLTDSKLAGIVETTAKQVRESIESLNAKYAAENRAFRVEQLAGGYQMLTLNIYNPWLKKMLRARSDNKLSPAAMETLAIIAYKQPVIRADIEAIRGVAVGEVIRSLMYKGLVKITGRAEILGRPMLYGTTKKFLEIFGLNSLKDLPKVEELKNPDRG
jgi:segregation and condensation protein B